MRSGSQTSKHREPSQKYQPKDTKYLVEQRFSSRMAAWISSVALFTTLNNLTRTSLFFYHVHQESLPNHHGNLESSFFQNCHRQPAPIGLNPPRPLGLPLLFQKVLLVLSTSRWIRGCTLAHGVWSSKETVDLKFFTSGPVIVGRVEIPISGNSEPLTNL